MVSAFLVLVPLVPLAAFQWSTPGARLGPLPQEPAETLMPSHSPPGPPCPDRGGPPSPLSARAVREASRGWEWKPLETPGWKILMADHFVLRGDVPVADLRTAGACLEEFHRMLRSSLGGDADGLMFSIRLFADPVDFRRYAALRGAANAESFYDPRSAEVVLCPATGRGEDWLQKALAHEFTHAYMDRVFRCTGPLWFAEGMAEYFAGFEVREGRACPGGVDRRTVLLLKLEEPMPLRDFVRLGRDEMYGQGFPALYAQAWLLVHHLFERKDGTIDLLLRGEPLKDAEALDKGWREHLEKQWDKISSQ